MRLSLFAFLFYSCVFVLWNFGWIPTPGEIFVFLENLYEDYGLIGVFFAVLLESVVFVGLYFPGSFILMVAIFLSGGTFSEFLLITILTVIALMVGSLINYYLGYFRVLRIKIPRHKKGGMWFLFTFIHPNTMAFYYYSLGLKKRRFWRILFVPLIIMVYGLALCYLFYSMKDGFRVVIENPFIMIACLGLWVASSYIYSWYKEREVKKKE